LPNFIFQWETTPPFLKTWALALIFFFFLGGGPPRIFFPPGGCFKKKKKAHPKKGLKKKIFRPKISKGGWPTRRGPEIFFFPPPLFPLAKGEKKKFNGPFLPFFPAANKPTPPPIGAKTVQKPQNPRGPGFFSL